MGKQCKIADFNTYWEIPNTGFKHRGPRDSTAVAENRSRRVATRRRPPPSRVPGSLIFHFYVVADARDSRIPRPVDPIAGVARAIARRRAGGGLNARARRHSMALRASTRAVVVAPSRRVARARRGVVAMAANADGSNAYALLTLDYVDGMLEKRAPHREAHLAGARRAHEEGKVVMAGALLDPVDQGVFVFKNCEREEIEAFVKADAYYVAGLVPRYAIRPWMVVVGN
jgi:uncharacterized protein YciI